MGRTACKEPQCLYKGAVYFTLSVQIIFIQTRQIPCYNGTQCSIGVITTIIQSKFNPVDILKTPLHKVFVYNPTHISASKVAFPYQKVA
jgi:hypothetical protein